MRFMFISPSLESVVMLMIMFVIVMMTMAVAMTVSAAAIGAGFGFKRRLFNGDFESQATQHVIQHMIVRVTQYAG